jgi:hypothetical protein
MIFLKLLEVIVPGEHQFFSEVGKTEGIRCQGNVLEDALVSIGTS